jgi:putative RNA 2'-phosphotransferase
MPNDRQTRLSKYLSYHLRHAPQAIGLTLETGGWVKVKDLLDAAARDRYTIDRQELEAIVANNDKKRFSFDETGEKIRANQGHSVDVDLQLEPMEPPAVLYHGTAEKFMPAILEEGLQKMSRHHVHLAVDAGKAKDVGKRQGKPVVLAINTAAMVADGCIFYRSDNGVWLTDRIPPQYLQKI